MPSDRACLTDLSSIFALEVDLPAARPVKPGENLQQSGLAGAVIAEEPQTSPLARWIEASFNAVTRPKDLETCSVRNISSLIVHLLPRAAEVHIDEHGNEDTPPKIISKV
jgi:hypothetical protein